MIVVVLACRNKPLARQCLAQIRAAPAVRGVNYELITRGGLAPPTARRIQQDPAIQPLCVRVCVCCCVLCAVCCVLCVKTSGQFSSSDLHLDRSSRYTPLSIYVVPRGVVPGLPRAGRPPRLSAGMVAATAADGTKIPNHRAAKTVYVMRSRDPANTSLNASTSLLGESTGVVKKKVMLARRMPPGATITLTDAADVSVTAPDGFDEAVDAIPQTLVSPTREPKSNPMTGDTLERSVLGAASEFDALMKSRRAGLDTSADFEEELSQAEGLGDTLLEDYRLKQELAREVEEALRAEKQELDLRAAAAREQDVGQRVHKPLIHEVMAEQKESNALQLWEARTREWERFKKR
jgi:hypothetical protein